jgi:hypothetical protein
MQKLKSTIWMLLFLLIYSTGYSQAVNLTIRLIDPEGFQQVLLSDLNLLDVGTAKDLFQVSITNTGTSDLENCIIISTLFQDGKELFKSTSSPFVIPPGSFSATNAQIANEGWILDPQRPETEIKIVDSKVSDEIADLQKDAFASNKLEAGSYVLRVDLIINNQTTTYDEITLSVTNPSYIQLVAPGSLGGYGPAAQIYDLFPLFQWNGNGTYYQVMVYEKRDVMQSKEDVLMATPNWVSDRLQGQLSIKYPIGSSDANGAVIPLEYGKNYVWLVKMFVPAAGGGFTEIMSEVWEFLLVDPNKSANRQKYIATDDLIRFLKTYADQPPQNLEQMLSGFYAKNITRNGQPITIEELYQLLQDYQRQNVKVTDVNLQGSN